MKRKRLLFGVVCSLILFCNGYSEHIYDEVSGKQQTATPTHITEVNSHLPKDLFQVHNSPIRNNRVLKHIHKVFDKLIINSEIKKTTQSFLKEVQAQQEAERRKRTIPASITTYGIDCVGCQSYNGRGGTAMGIALDAALGVMQPNGEWKAGIQYGGYYIIAADPSIPMCSIFKISNHGLSGAGIQSDQPFYAMVMDRGGAIQGNHFDLYIGLQSANPLQRIYVSTANAELIRYGGSNKQGCAL